MYIPKHFEVTDHTALHDLMEQFSFAMLITSPAGKPVATHLPLQLDRRAGEHGTLIGHLARANGQWKAFGDGEALVVFQGHHAYVSPSWYEKHPSVPTWNYMTVHAYGVPRIVEDEGRVLASLRGLVDAYEYGEESPWSMDSLSAEYLQGMVKGIVAFEIPITRLEGKFKLSQNRPATDQERVITALSRSDDRDARGVAAAMLARASDGG